MKQKQSSEEEIAKLRTDLTQHLLTAKEVEGSATSAKNDLKAAVAKVGNGIKGTMPVELVLWCVLYGAFHLK